VCLHHLCRQVSLPRLLHRPRSPAGGAGDAGGAAGAFVVGDDAAGFEYPGAPLGGPTG
jgi:hypothetical protein